VSAEMNVKVPGDDKFMGCGCSKGEKRTVIEVSYLFLRCIVGCLVCDSDNRSLSATNDNCSPRWIVHYAERHHHNYVLKLVSITKDVFLLTCLECLSNTAGRFPGEIDVVGISLTSRSLISSDNVTIRQVHSHEVIMYRYVILCSKLLN